MRAGIDHDDFAGDVADLNAIAGTHAEFADQEEVTDDRHEDALHGNCDTGRQQAREGRKRARLRREGDAAPSG